MKQPTSRICIAQCRSLWSGSCRYRHESAELEILRQTFTSERSLQQSICLASKNYYKIHSTPQSHGIEFPRVHNTTGLPTPYTSSFAQAWLLPPSTISQLYHLNSKHKFGNSLSILCAPTSSSDRRTSTPSATPTIVPHPSLAAPDFPASTQYYGKAFIGMDCFLRTRSLLGSCRLSRFVGLRAWRETIRNVQDYGENERGEEERERIRSRVGRIIRSIRYQERTTVPWREVKSQLLAQLDELIEVARGHLYS